MLTMDQATKVDGYALQPPDGEWGYVIDGSNVIYRRGLVAQKLRRGWWPFADRDTDQEQRERHSGRYGVIPQECGWASVRLSPDVRLYSWRNEYVLAGPDLTVPHMAHASAHLWVEPRRTISVEYHLNLADHTWTIDRLPDDAPQHVRDQANAKGDRLVAFFKAACEARDGTDREPVTAAQLEAERRARYHEKIRAYCAEHGMRYAPVEGWDEYAVIDGERLALFQIAARWLPDLFGDSR